MKLDARISRRRLLLGAGSAALALPALEAFTPTSAYAKGNQPRLLIYYLPNGRRPEWWVPTGSDGALNFPTQSTALQPFANRMIALENLSNNAALGSPGAAHAMGTGTVTTGRTISTVAGGALENGVSIDQLLVQQCRPKTRFASLQWSSGEPGPCDVGGSSCAYTQSISWTAEASPLVPTIDPSAAFERLFGAGVDGIDGPSAELRRQTKQSVIDFVHDDARALQTTLGSADKETLEGYFDALRDLERLLEEDGQCSESPQAPLPGLDYAGRVDAFSQLIRLAFLCDQTRVMSFMIEFGLSGRSHAFLDAPGGHHGLSHYGDTTGYQRLERVEQWQSEQLGALLALLSGTPGTEGGASLLDETIVLALPSMGEGSSHDHARNCPILFGGSGVLGTTGRKIAGGGRPLTDLHVSLLEAFGVDGAFGRNGAIFGDDGTAAIPGIVA